MIQYRVPATSANLGVGFDCLGLALSIYNEFEIEESNSFLLEGFVEDLDEENLFIRAYRTACFEFGKAFLPLHVKMTSDIPMSRGLGSSSALIVAGIFACFYIHKMEIDRAEAQAVAARIEGHPDNVTPCIYGGLCASYGRFVSRFTVDDRWHFYVLIPDYEVKTAAARRVVRKRVRLEDAVSNISAALIGVRALEDFDVTKIEVLNYDSLHEPYRMKLIPDYEKCKDEAMLNGAKAFLISGSGSTMLAISDRELQLSFDKIFFKEVQVDKEGIKCLQNF